MLIVTWYISINSCIMSWTSHPHASVTLSHIAKSINFFFVCIPVLCGLFYIAGHSWDALCVGSCIQVLVFLETSTHYCLMREKIIILMVSTDKGHDRGRLSFYWNPSCIRWWFFAELITAACDFRVFWYFSCRSEMTFRLALYCCLWICKIFSYIR